MEKNYCLIELYDGHGECIYSQYKYLKSENTKLFLVANKKVYEKLPDMDFEDTFIFETNGVFSQLIMKLKKNPNNINILKKSIFHRH